MQELLNFLILGIGILLTCIGADRLYSLSRVATWPRACGIVLNSAIKTTRVHSRFSWDEYSPDINFQYEIHGKKQCSRIFSIDSSGFSYKNKNDATATLKRFPAGSKIEAYVSPTDHSIAALTSEIDPRRKSHFIAIVVAGLLLSAFGLISIYVLP